MTYVAIQSWVRREVSRQSVGEHFDVARQGSAVPKVAVPVAKKLPALSTSVLVFGLASASLRLVVVFDQNRVLVDRWGIGKSSDLGSGRAFCTSVILLASERVDCSHSRLNRLAAIKRIAEKTCCTFCLFGSYHLVNWRTFGAFQKEFQTSFK